MPIDWSDAIAWFGRKPDFHDAEVTGLELRRSPEKSHIRILAWNTANMTDNHGYLMRERQVTVCLTLEEIVECDLRGWNHQNVLLSLEEIKKDVGSKIALHSSFGLEGTVAANSIVVEIEYPDNCSTQKKLHLIDRVQFPGKIVPIPNGTMQYRVSNATVVVNPVGRVLTVWPQ